MMLIDVFEKNNVICHNYSQNPVTNSNKTRLVDFRQGQEELHKSLRQGMLDAATRLLSEEGPGALTVRRVAEAVNCSTTLLYSLFGGKDGLANELYLEGFERLKQEFSADPANTLLAGLPRLRALARAYHHYAKHNPSYYMVMFGDAIAGFVPPVESRKRAWESLAVLIEAFDACMHDGSLPRSNPTAAARLLWAAMHGAISLELKGYYLKTERADELFDAAVHAVLRSLEVGPAPPPPSTP